MTRAHAHEKGHEAHGASPNRVAALATLHCLTGCAIGEVLGMVIGTAAGLGNPATIALSVVLAFLFGYSLTLLPLLRSGLGFAAALPLAFASDTLLDRGDGDRRQRRDPRRAGRDGRRPRRPAVLGLARSSRWRSRSCSHSR